MTSTVDLHRQNVPHTTDAAGGLYPSAFTGIGANRHMQSISSTYSSAKAVTWSAEAGPHSITILVAHRSGTITLGTNTPAALKFVVDAIDDLQAQNYLADATGANTDVEYLPIFLPPTTATAGNAQGAGMASMTIDFPDRLRRLDFQVTGGSSLVVDVFVIAQ